MTQAYPLAWPQGRPRKSQRKAAPFSTKAMGHGSRSLTVADALQRLRRELTLLDARHVVISTNVELRADGLPRSGGAQPQDPGAAIYFQLAGKPHCMACDTYNRVADNLAALAAHIEATRRIERHGVASAAEMFAGFQALPAPGARRPWWQVFGFESGNAESLETVESRNIDAGAG